MPLNIVSGTSPRSFAYLLTALISLSILAGCATPNPRSVPAATPNVEPVNNQVSSNNTDIRSWFLEVRELVEQQLDVNLTKVQLRVVDATSIQKFAQYGLRRALKHDINNDEFAESLVNNIMTTHSAGSVLAIYSPEIQSILLHGENLADYINTVAGLTSERSAVQALLLHELIHAADDIKHQVFAQRNATYQEVFSKSTILEGHAQWQARRLCQYAGCTSAFHHMNDYMFRLSTVEDPALSYLQKRNFRNLEFIYREGERFVDHLMQQNNGRELLEMAFNHPPRDSLQIIDPSSFPNRGRENRNRRISSVIKDSKKPWRDNEKGLLTRNIVAAAAFDARPETRNPIIEFYNERVVAAAKHEYYDRNSQLPIPVAITVMQTDNDTTAKNTAELIFDSTASTYRKLDGQLVQLSNWQRGEHATVVSDNLLGSVNIDINFASGTMNNQMVNSEYPFEVVTASSGDFIVHIDGRFNGSDKLMQYAGYLLLELQRSSMQLAASGEN